MGFPIKKQLLQKTNRRYLESFLVMAASETYELNACPEKLEEVYTVEEQLGKGQFAVVKKCHHKESGAEGAAKFIKVKRTRASRSGLSRELIAREASLLKGINHDQIIKLYDVFDNGPEVVLVLELLSGGELFDEISKMDYLTEIDACIYTKQVLEAIAYIHALKIVHLDIKPENIVLKEKSKPDIKLVDFGLAEHLTEGQELKTMVGTPEFVAPEIVNFESVGFYTDMWAIGVLVFVMLSGCSPFLGDDDQETYANIASVDYEMDEEEFGKISQEAKDLIENLLVKAPKKRLTGQRCLEHAWMQAETSQSAKENSTRIDTKSLRAFVARRKWQANVLKLHAVTRFAMGVNKLPSQFSVEVDDEGHPLDKSSNGDQLPGVQVSDLKDGAEQYSSKFSSLMGDLKLAANEEGLKETEAEES